MTNFLLYAASVLIWGSTWITIDYQLGEVPVEASLAYRYLLGAGLLFAWCALRGKSLRFDVGAHGYFLLMGVFLFGLNYMAAYAAQFYITSALNAIAFSSLVWMNIINARLFLGTRIEPRTYAGAALGMTGIVALFWPEVMSVSLADGILIGAALSLTGALLASFGNIISQRAQQRRLPVLQSNAWGMLYGGLLNGLAAALQGKPFAFDTSTGYVLSLLYLAIFGSVVAFGCYLTLLGRIGAHRAGYVVVMFPIVALVLSALFEGLTFDTHIIAGVLLALAGNMLILSRTQGGRRSVAPPGSAGGVLPATSKADKPTA